MVLLPKNPVIDRQDLSCIKIMAEMCHADSDYLNFRRRKFKTGKIK